MKHRKRNDRHSGQRSPEGEMMTRSVREEELASLAEMFSMGRKATPGNVRAAGIGTDQERYQQIPGISGKAGVNGSLSLRQKLPQMPGTATKVYNISAGDSFTLSTAIAERSRFAQAGAHIIPIDQPPAPVNAPAGSFYTRPGSFTILEPASFQGVGSESLELSTSPLPYSSMDVDLYFLRERGVRVEIPRSEQKDVGDDAMSARIMGAIAMGLADLVDAEMAYDIDLAIAAMMNDTGSGIPYFLISKAAAKGLRFDELRAVVGTDATGAAVSQDGMLRVHGVPAELTKAMSETYVGAFDRSAVAIMDDIRVLVERTSVNGRLTLTVWADLSPLIPDVGYFWVAGS